MNIPQSISFLSPEEIATREIAEPDTARLPNLASLFKDREIRLRQLAAGHSMRDFLIFMADLASAQHNALNDAALIKSQAQDSLVPGLELLQAHAKAGTPVLDPKHWALDPTWRRELDFILAQVLSHLPGEATVKGVIEEIKSMTQDQLNEQAQSLLLGQMGLVHMGAAPLIAAALQVFWVRLAARTAKAYPQQTFPAVADATHCPCCGSKPVSSINRLGSDVGTSRYLNCSLCQTQWYMARIKCTHCESTKGIAYHSLVNQEGHAVHVSAMDEGGVSLETCDTCSHYLKIVNMAKDVQVEPVADDLATLTLDLLIAEEGYWRGGVNFMMLFGGNAENSADPPKSIGEH